MSVRVLFFRYAVKSENARDRIAEQFAEIPKYFANAMQLLISAAYWGRACYHTSYEAPVSPLQNI